MYADDTTLITTARNLSILKDITENPLKNPSLWFTANSLKINDVKT